MPPKKQGGKLLGSVVSCRYPLQRVSYSLHQLLPDVCAR